MKEGLLLPGETWEDLGRQGFGVIQAERGYRFSMDAVLLAKFAADGGGDEALDLGTGCGVIPMLLAARLPNVRAVGLEIQEQQVFRARRSVAANGLEGRVRIDLGDIRELDMYQPGSFDLITANPPFYRRGEGRVSANMEAAISRHELHVTLGHIFSAARLWMRPAGRFCMVIRTGRLQEAVCTAEKNGLKLSRLCLVYPKAGADANLALFEFVTRSTSLRIEPPLVIYDEQGAYTRQVISLYFD